MGTSFSLIYDSFLSRVTSDMYMEMTALDTIRELQSLLLNAIPRFKFPKFDIYDYEEGYWDDLGTYTGPESDGKAVPAVGWIGGHFNSELTTEEINILSVNMLIEWFYQQLATTDNTRLKYTGSDYKMSSQANHMAKLKNLIEFAKQETKSLQDIYRRKTVVNHKTYSTLGEIMQEPSYGYGIEGGIYGN